MNKPASPHARQIHQLSAADALASLQSQAGGLSEAEVERRLREYGSNAVAPVRRVPLWLRLGRELSTFFSLILWIAAALAFFAAWEGAGHDMEKVGYAIVVVILVSGAFSFWQEFRVERILSTLQRLLPQRSQVLRAGTLMQVPAERLVPGDIVFLQQGDRVPADCRLIEAFGARVNNAAVTGEALPQVRDSAPSDVPDLLTSRNVVLAGTTMVSGQITAVVYATGAHTEFGKIAHLSQTAEGQISPLREEIGHLSRLTAILALLIGGLFFAAGSLTGIPLWKAFIFAIGIIVAMVPEGLLPTLTLALVLATQRMARRNVLIRYLPAVETLGSTTVICTDKTGTLTQNRMLVRQLLLGGSLLAPGDVAARPAQASQYGHLFQAARSCHDLKESAQAGKLQWQGDSMELALVEMALAVASPQLVTAKLDEIAFDTERMRLSTLHRMGQEFVSYCKGAPESLLPLCQSVLVDGQPQALDAAQRARIVQAQEHMAGQGLRVLAFAFRTFDTQPAREQMEQQMVFAGLAGLEDPPRAEVPDAIRKCGMAGIGIIMITGDHPHTAVAIARQIGMITSDHPTVITGEQLRHLSPTQLQLALDSRPILFARVMADQKMRIVQALKNKGQIVAVTGDGVNDAPALKAAHIGIAMGLSGTDVAKEAADMVLLDDNFASIVAAIEEGRAVFDNIRKFLTYVLVHNVAELIPYLGFILFNIPLALTAIQALSVDMGSDSLAALGLGVERPDPRVMQRPPRPQGERLMNWPLALRAYLFLGLIEAAAAMAAFFLVLRTAGWHYGDVLAPHAPAYLQATTACLSTIIVMQIVNVFLCRSPTRSLASTGLMGNRLILSGVLLEVGILLLVNFTDAGNALLDTAPFPGRVWAVIVPCGVAMGVLEEWRKWIVRRSASAR
ncbi:MAG TPA: cation-transporting P-type ATPase [Burkholderiaceae bacterium]|nr:cation-transporting P-type ATPase [Burkholderiaceae bacterium]